MRSTKFLDKFFSFFKCLEPRENIYDKPDCINSDDINENSLNYYNAEINLPNNYNVLYEKIDTNISLFGDYTVEIKVDDLYNLQNKKDLSERIEEKLFSENPKE